MNALLLAGGMGTRLRPLTDHMPKPMALVGNRPWLEHLVLQLKNQGFSDFVMAVQYYSEQIRNYFGDGSKWGVRIRYAVEHTLRGTAGAIKNAEPYLDDRFVVVNADIVQEADLADLLEFHRMRGGLVTIGLTEVEDPSHYGVIEQDGEDRIIRFVEKPRRDEAPSNRINAGIYVMEKQSLQYIPDHREVSIERETFPLLIKENAGVYGKVISGYWMDMGTKERYRAIHWDLLNRVCRLPLDGEERGSGIWIGDRSEIAPGALLIPPVLIGNGCKIGERSIVGPFAVLGDNCEIGKGVRCSETIMWDNCTAHDAVHLNNCILGYGLEVGSRQIMHEAVMNRMEAKEA
ncbi:sugar phosphate nucleotidyltransferase [Paenibacillus thailandensis]|uniref:Sugar phosphate nucleotidyltransferase n=1 Tax=Paenibacillus thailandensis TaxID=393250 RepID=A0ABW5QTS6_9BACL